MRVCPDPLTTDKMGAAHEPLYIFLSRSAIISVLRSVFRHPFDVFRCLPRTFRIRALCASSRRAGVPSRIVILCPRFSPLSRRFEAVPMLRALLPSVASQRRLEGLRSVLYPVSDPCARSVLGCLRRACVPSSVRSMFLRACVGSFPSDPAQADAMSLRFPYRARTLSVVLPSSSEGPRRTSGSCAKKHEKNDALNRVFPRMMCVLGVFHFSRLPAGLVHGTKRGVFHPLYIFLARRPKTWCFTDSDVPLHAALKHRFIP